MKKPTIDFPIEETRFGFIYGPADISRLCDDKRMGVYLNILTKREQIDIRVTPGGKISVYSHEKRRGKYERD